jgi:hypothetical protein
MRARAIVRGYLIATEWRGRGCGNEAICDIRRQRSSRPWSFAGRDPDLRHGSLGKNRSFSSHRSSFRMTRGARMHWYGADRFV